MASSVTSIDMVKPSSPTPPHLRNLKLSILDQQAQPYHIPLIFFYKNYHPKPEASLKKSLSNVLTQFYPLAGRFSRDKSTLDCNDSGALFVECKVEGNLLEVIKDPAMDELQKYMPQVESSSNGDMIILAVQINLFDCGGVAITVQMLHKVGDASSLVTFMNAWAAASRGFMNDDGETFSPKEFDMATMFPPREMFMNNTSGSGSDSSEQKQPMVLEKVVTKRLVLGKKDLENLKLQQASNSVVKDPTRVEAVTSFLMKHFIEASRARGSKKQAALLHAVSLRPRMDPPLPSISFGNLVQLAVGLLPVEYGNYVDLVKVLRDAIRKIDGDLVKEIQKCGDEYLNYHKIFEEMSLKEPWFFTSWTRFPVYGVDYGWGKPTWVTAFMLPCKNVVVLMSTSSEDGIEAWVNLLEQDAAFIDFSL